MLDAKAVSPLLLLIARFSEFQPKSNHGRGANKPTPLPCWSRTTTQVQRKRSRDADSQGNSRQDVADGGRGPRPHHHHPPCGSSATSVFRRSVGGPARASSVRLFSGSASRLGLARLIMSLSLSTRS